MEKGREKEGKGDQQIYTLTYRDTGEPCKESSSMKIHILLNNHEIPSFIDYGETIKDDINEHLGVISMSLSLYWN